MFWFLWRYTCSMPSLKSSQILSSSVVFRLVWHAGPEFPPGEGKDGVVMVGLEIRPNDEAREKQWRKIASSSNSSACLAYLKSGVADRRTTLVACESDRKWRAQEQMVQRQTQTQGYIREFTQRAKQLHNERNRRRTLCSGRDKALSG